MPKLSLTETEVEAFRKLASVDDVARFLGTSRKRLFFHLYDRKRPGYRSFILPKASGGHRQISAPPKVLAAFQHRLLLALEAVAPSKPYAHGFTRGRSVRTNAEPHVGSRLVLNFDLLDFFPSIHFGRIQGLFRSHPFDFSHPVAAVLAHICCAAKVLPQGAPTSPIISNLICRGLDKGSGRLSPNASLPLHAILRRHYHLHEPRIFSTGDCRSILRWTRRDLGACCFECADVPLVSGKRPEDAD